MGRKELSVLPPKLPETNFYLFQTTLRCGKGHQPFGSSPNTPEAEIIGRICRLAPSADSLEDLLP